MLFKTCLQNSYIFICNPISQKGNLCVCLSLCACLISQHALFSCNTNSDHFRMSCDFEPKVNQYSESKNSLCGFYVGEVVCHTFHEGYLD